MSTAVAERIETAPVEVPVKDQELSMIERLAGMPSVNMDVIDRLFALRERREKETSRKEMLADFAAFQKAAPMIEKKGTGNNKTKYARLEDVIGAALPVLTEHGFSLRHDIEQADGKIRVTAVLGHKSGHVETASIELPADTTGNKNPVQSHGSTVQYGRRYTAMAVLGMAAEGEDDDAKAVSAKSSPKPSDEDIAKLFALMEQTQTEPMSFFVNLLGIPNKDELTADKLAVAMNLMTVKRDTQAKAAAKAAGK